MSTDAAPVVQQQHSAVPQQQQLWAEARQSVFKGLMILTAAAAVFGLFVWRLPPLQVGKGSCPHDTHVLDSSIAAAVAESSTLLLMQAHEVSALLANFPPRSLASVILFRDTLMSYADANPVGLFVRSSCSAVAVLLEQHVRPPAVVALSAERAVSMAD